MQNLSITNHLVEFNNYLLGNSVRPLFFCADSLDTLRQLPSASIDFCMTSPPYWGQRQYTAGGIGLEKTWTEYIQKLLSIFKEVHRLLKPTGSFWLNLGDTYESKALVGIPWRVAVALTDQQGWILRNDVIWNKVKGGPDNSLDRLRNVHEHIFHFVKEPKNYYYDADAIRSKPRETKIVNGAIVSATGVTGVRYKRQIELSTSLTEKEKRVCFHSS